MPLLLEFRDEREWERFHFPKELSAAISIEASELQELFLWRKRETAEEITKDTLRMDLIKDEVADIMIYLLFITNDLKIDLHEAVQQKIMKNRKKYPVEEYRGKYRKH